MELITTHTNSDFDSLGAMIAAKKLYPGALTVFPGSQERTLRRFFLESSSYATGFSRVRDIDLDQVTTLIIVDVDQASRIGPFGALVGKPGVEVHVYDHHPETPESIHGAVRKVEKVGASTTMMVEILKEKGIPVDTEEATMMLLGIFEDTGGLTFSTTTPRDFEAAGYLLSLGADLATVREFNTPELTAAQVALLDELLKSRADVTIHGVTVTVAEAEMDEYVGDMALLAHKMCDMESLDALVAFARMGDRIHLVCRGRVPEFDGSVIARKFGGGGHPEAASATIKDMTPLEFRDELNRILPRAVKPKRTSRDLLSSPAKTVESGRTIAEARDILNRYHVNSLPVTRDGKLAGIITRLVVERAISHDLFDARVEDYMSTDFSTVGPGASLEKVRDIIVGMRQRLLPVMEGGELIGVVTRTDLLNALAPPGKQAQQAAERVQVRNAKKLLTELVDREVLKRLVELGTAASRLGMKAYLVGGMVRDLMLRNRNLDVDIVVEGDGVELAEALAARWGVAAHPHRVFKTSMVKTPEGLKIDIATARTEYYRSPAALPTVEQSSLKLDLTRRDFTINALAMRLEPHSVGEVVDFFGGLKDLKDKSIRILHNLSFVEDPTRVLRAVRFALRFGFTIQGQTRRLFENSIKEGFLARARGQRLFRELKMVLEEAPPEKAAALMEAEGILKSFHPSLKFDERVAHRFENIREVSSWYRLLYLDQPLEEWKLYILALLEPLTESEVGEWAKDFGVASSHGRWFVEARRKTNKILAELRRAADGGEIADSVIYRACAGVNEETLLFAMARTSDPLKKKAMSRYHTKLAAVRITVTGSDLKAMGIPPGPLYRRLLDGLLDARLDKEVLSRDDELKWVTAKWSGNASGSVPGSFNNNAG